MSEVKTATMFLSDLPADPSTRQYTVHVAEEAIEILSWGLTTHTTAVTKADTNYTTWTLTNGSSAVGAIANGPNTAAGSSIALGVISAGSVDDAYSCIDEGDVLTLEGVKTGTGLIIAGAIITIKYRQARN